MPEFFFVLLAALFYLAVDWVRERALCREEPASQRQRVLRLTCRLLLGALLALYGALVLLTAVVDGNSLAKGNIGEGLGLFVVAGLLAVCIWFWLVRPPKRR